MAANKTFSLLAILSLALGIGANTAIYSVMDALLLRSLPVTDPQSLVILSWRTPQNAFNGTNRHDADYTDPNGGYIGGIVAYPAFELFRKYDSVFASVFGYQSAGKLHLTFRGHAELADTEYVSGEYFLGLGTPPAAGRLIAPDDDHAGAPAVAVISFALSQRRFGGPASASGQSILINNVPFTVIGATPPEFFGADPEMAPDIYVPMHANLLLDAGNRIDPPVRPVYRTRITIGSCLWRPCAPASARSRPRPPWLPRFSNGRARQIHSATWRTLPRWLSGKAAVSTVCGDSIRSRCTSYWRWWASSSPSLARISPISSWRARQLASAK
jgi:hypothetical protein